MLTSIALDQLVCIVLIGLGMSFVITGASIGKPIRFMGWLLLRAIKLDALVRCPFCNAWWMGGALAFLFGLPWEQWLQAAFATCGAAAIVQAQWGLAADEDFDAALEK